MKRTYIESVKKYYVKILSEAVKKKSVSVSEFMALNRKWDRAYHKLEVDKK